MDEFQSPSEENPLPPQPESPRRAPKGLPEKLIRLVSRITEGPADFFRKKLSEADQTKVSVSPVPSDAESGPAEPVGGGLLSKIRPLLSRYGRFLIVLLLAVAIGFGVKRFFFSGKKDQGKTASLEEIVSQEKAKKEENAIPVKGFKVGRFNFEDSLNALGTIKGSVEFKLSFEIPGAISSINYREGERYEEGALLISLRQDDILLRLKRAQADLNKAQTQTEIVSEKYKEHKKLFKLGAISRSTLANVKLELESSQFEAEGARLEVKAHEAMLEKSNLYAPSAGMIGELNIEEGETITPNTMLGSHISTEFVFAEFGIVERDVNKIALGQKSRVFVDAYPDKTFEGVIENIAPVVAGTSRTATARVRIENPERLLLPGMFTRIRILLYSKKNTLVIPTDSIQGGEGEQFIYVVHLNQDAQPETQAGTATGTTQPPGSPEAAGEQTSIAPESDSPGASPKEKAKNQSAGQVEKRAITVGYTRPDYSQIDAGISEGEVIAVSGLERLDDGKKIRLLETQEAEI